MKPQTVISTETLQQLLREFKQQRGGEFDLQALGYFGSYARGEAKPDSDKVKSLSSCSCYKPANCSRSLSETFLALTKRRICHLVFSFQEIS
ncbi:MAG: nucleotidyltransferase domain-containing protein [Cyanobacteria bacterium J06623_5]